MNTREEAVEYLRRRGFEAAKRDWNLGETIAIYADPLDPELYRKRLYIFPDGARWGIYDLSSYFVEPPAEFETLRAAVEAAIAALESPGPPG